MMTNQTGKIKLIRQTKSCRTVWNEVREKMKEYLYDSKKWEKVIWLKVWKTPRGVA